MNDAAKIYFFLLFYLSNIKDFSLIIVQKQIFRDDKKY